MNALLKPFAPWNARNGNTPTQDAKKAEPAIIGRAGFSRKSRGLTGREQPYLTGIDRILSPSGVSLSLPAPAFLLPAAVAPVWIGMEVELVAPR